MAVNPYAPQPGAPAGGWSGILGSGGFGQGGIIGQANRAIQGGQQAGYFDPMGSPAIRAAVRANALRTQRNRLQRGDVLRRLLGLDPQQQRAAQLGLEQQSGSDISNAILGADLGQLEGSQNFLRSLFGQQLAGQQQIAAARAAAKAQQAGGIGNFIGQLGGAVVPWALNRYLPAPKQASS